jgi:large subunit ribosomal protein L13e
MQLPRATVKRWNEERKGRGYSLKELDEAGIDFRIALKRGMRVDKLRRSVHKVNINQLKAAAEMIEPAKKKKA